MKAGAALATAGVLLLAATGTAHAGYTHYWKWKKDPEPKALAACVAEMDRIADARRSILTDGEGRPGKAAKFVTSCAYGDAGELPCIMFNGVGDEAHETFGFPLAPFAGTPAFSFVKTAWKPYDLPAAACLIVARDHFPPDQLAISSDGTWSGEWRDAAALYTRVLGRFAHDPLTANVLQPDAAAAAAPEAGVDDAGSPAAAPPPATSPRDNSRYRTLVIGVVVITLIVAAYGFSRKP